VGCSNIIIGFFVYFPPQSLSNVLFLYKMGLMPLLFQLLNVEIELVFLYFFNRKSNLGEYLPTPFCLIKILTGFHMEATKAIKN